jgi:hypothetical protein
VCCKTMCRKNVSSKFSNHASFFCPSRKPGIGGVSVKICLSSGTGASSILLPSSCSSTEDRKRINIDQCITRKSKTWQGRHSDITQTYFPRDVLIDFYFTFERLPRVFLDRPKYHDQNCIRINAAPHAKPRLDQHLCNFRIDRHLFLISYVFLRTLLLQSFDK